jgi:hypothetical protein
MIPISSVLPGTIQRGDRFPLGEDLAGQTITGETEGATEQPVPIQITYGYSRDRRPDLKQFMNVGSKPPPLRESRGFD